jgi:hypothetical protein
MSQAPGKPTYLQDSLYKRGVLGWWYSLMAYHLPEGQKPTLRDQERIRRSRLATFVLMVQLFLIEGPVVPVVAAAPNHALVLPWLLGCLVVLLLAIGCNKYGKLIIAGLFMVLSIEITVGIKILTVPGGIGLASLPQFDILIQPVLLAVVLLPPWSAFVVAFGNMVFIVFSLVAGPHAPDLAAALHNPVLVGDIFAVPVMSECIIATVAFLIVANLLSALKRASRAEQIAQLEHSIAESQRSLEARNKELETGVATLTQTIQSAANSQGGTYERINLPSGHVLWPVLQQIWHFLDRFQRARQAEAVLATSIQASTELIQALERVEQGQPFQPPPRRQTPLDGVAFTLANLFQRSSRGGSTSGTLNSSAYPAGPK